jgi:pilus assembly protein CpaC
VPLPPAATPAAPVPTASPCGRVEVAPVVQIPVGKSTVIKPKTPVARILLGNPENARAARPTETPGQNSKEEGVAKPPTVDTRPGVADVDVLLLGPTEVYLLGKSIGSTNVVMLDRDGLCTAFDVVVAMDTAALQALFAQLLPAETGIKVTAAFDSIVLSGTVSDSEALARATELANAFVRRGDGGSDGKRNPRVLTMLEVGAPQQVMLEVKVAEVSKAVLDKFGIDFSRAYVPGDGSMIRFMSGIFGGNKAVGGQISGTTGALVGGGSIGSTTNGQTIGMYTAPIGDARLGDNPVIPLAAGKNVTLGGVDAQKNDGLVKILAEPTVMAISGQTGSFLAGGKIFIPVSQVDGSGGRTVTLEEKEFGVSVKFTPTVLGSGRINLRVRPEVSELNREGVGISAPGVSGLAILPAFTSRKAETTVQLMDGQSFAIGGLVKNNTTTNVKAFPFLGEIPVLGALFRSSEFQNDRSELVFVITPRLVAPLPADYKLPTDNYVPPSRSELMWHGKVEGTREKKADAPSAEATPAQGGFDMQAKEK